MNKDITDDEFVEILLDPEITKPINLNIFQSLYLLEGRKGYASQLGKILGVKSKLPASPVNLEIGRIGKRIGDKYNIKHINGYSKQVYWTLFFKGWDDKGLFVWQLKENLITALEITGLTGEIAATDEISLQESYQLFEGAQRTIKVNAYERNAKARQQCIEHYGARCSVCDFDFEREYGPIGKGFIHVHHMVPLADIGRAYEVDPENDLIPVCPNCHAMLHSSKETLTIEELKSLYLKAQAGQG